MGTPALSWRRLGVLLRQLPMDARTVRAYAGESLAWSPTQHLLAGIFDILNWANYQRGGGKGPKPKPIERPGQKKPVDVKRLGTAVPIEEGRRILDNWSN